MRKVLFLLLSVLCLASCQRDKINADFIAKSNPIMPVRMTADTMTIQLTDYVPAFFGGKDTLWPQEMEVINAAHQIDAIMLSDKTGNVSIPVLPNKPVRQAFISLGYEANSLHVGFYDEVENPHIVAYVQNMRIDPAYWLQTDDNEWIIDLSIVPEIQACSQGRAYLRVFAEDETNLFNDLLLPLENGKVVTSTEQLNRHDQQAQVLYSVLIDRFYNGNNANGGKKEKKEKKNNANGEKKEKKNNGNNADTNARNWEGNRGNVPGHGMFSQEFLDKLLADKVITQEEYDALKKALPERPERPADGENRQKEKKQKKNQSAGTT